MYFVPPLTGFPLELGIRAGRVKTTRMMRLPEVQSFKIGLVVYTQYRRVTDRWTDRQTGGQTPHDGKDRTVQSVARVKTDTVSGISD